MMVPRRAVRRRRLFAALLAWVAAGCAGEDRSGVLTVSGSALGTEAEVLRRQAARFAAERGIEVEIRVTPDAADQRHQLYVQWLNARADAPDVLQLDVIWTAEFAAAGWILPLDRFDPPADSFFPAAIEANRWRGELYALPWFVDVGMLYWRTDLMAAPPTTLDELEERAAAASTEYGFVWQGARYEGLVTVFVEFLGAHGGRILDASGAIVVDSDAAVRALTALRAAIHTAGITPASVLTWQEEQTRFAFQNGGAAFMRNWPYAYALMNDSSESQVAGRFAVAAMPAGPGGARTATLGGAQLAINAYSTQPELAYELIAYLTAPAQMLERAEVVAQFPPRPDLYDDPRLAAALSVPPAQARDIIAQATPRPVTPVYTELSQILQIHLHRALTRQRAPAAALAEAAREMRALLERTGLAAEADRAPR
jgi:ABC-type glycerol-3-phosphate transport system substrate-binding protein